MRFLSNPAGSHWCIFLFAQVLRRSQLGLKQLEGEDDDDAELKSKEKSGKGRGKGKSRGRGRGKAKATPKGKAKAKAKHDKEDHEDQPYLADEEVEEEDLEGDDAHEKSHGTTPSEAKGEGNEKKTDSKEAHVKNIANKDAFRRGKSTAALTHEEDEAQEPSSGGLAGHVTKEVEHEMASAPGNGTDDEERKSNHEKENIADDAKEMPDKGKEQPEKKRRKKPQQEKAGQSEASVPIEADYNEPAPSGRKRKVKAEKSEKKIKDCEEEAKESEKGQKDVGEGKGSRTRKRGAEAMTFARRVEPKSEFPKLKWQVLRDCFAKTIKPVLSHYSAHEDFM